MCEIKAFWRHSGHQISKFSSFWAENVLYLSNFLSILSYIILYFLKKCPIFCPTPLLESLYVHTVLFEKSQSYFFIKWVFLSAENAISKCYSAPRPPSWFNLASLGFSLRSASNHFFFLTKLSFFFFFSQKLCNFFCFFQQFHTWQPEICTFLLM